MAVDQAFKAHRTAALIMQLYFKGPCEIFKRNLEDDWLEGLTDFSPYYFYSGELSEHMINRSLNFKGMWVAYNLCLKHSILNIDDWKRFDDIMP